LKYELRSTEGVSDTATLALLFCAKVESEKIAMNIDNKSLIKDFII
jgi:hypothetical protein